MRYYSTTAGEMVLQTGISPSDTNVVVDTTAGLPVTFPYTLLLDYGTASEEVVDVTAAASTTLTVTRGVDGTVAQAHAFGAKIRHGVTARDHRESREHEASVAAHGVAVVVGKTEAQSLDNKVFEPDADHQAIVVRTRSGNTEPVMEYRDHADGVFARVSAELVEHVSGSDVYSATSSGGRVNLFKRILSLRVGNDHHAITGDVVGTPTGRFIRLMSGATELFSVSASGNVTAPNIPTATVGAWTAYTPTLGGITIGNGTVSAYYAVVGKTTHVRVKITAGTTTSFSAVALTVSLPVAASAAGYDQVPMGTAYLLDASIGSASRTPAVAVQSGNAAFFVTPSGTVSNTVPWTWTTSDQLNFTATYEAA